MKKILVTVLGIFLGTLCLQAEDSSFSLFVEKRTHQAANEYDAYIQLKQAIKNKKADEVQRLLKDPKNIGLWNKKDNHGNNLFHLCSDVKTFEVLYKSLGSKSESLLAAKNKAGETPWMTYIMYGKEDIFLTYFPKSSLYARLQQISFDLKHSTGLSYNNAITNRDAVIKETSCRGGQTLWQRADLMCRSLRAGAKGYAQYERTPANAPGMNAAEPIKNKMEQIRDMIEEVAPYLK